MALREYRKFCERSLERFGLPLLHIWLTAWSDWFRALAFAYLAHSTARYVQRFATTGISLFLLVIQLLHNTTDKLKQNTYSQGLYSDFEDSVRMKRDFQLEGKSHR
jgi:hypothetical protein